VSPIYRRYYKKRKRKIADGTRYMRVKFPKNVCSLPYAIKFDVNGTQEYFRTIHSDQMKVCNRCLSPDHTVRYCQQNLCFVCRKYGHISIDCPENNCHQCRQNEANCTCNSDSENDSIIEPASKSQKVDNPMNGDNSL